jgi:hypothetical protein
LPYPKSKLNFGNSYTLYNGPGWHRGRENGQEDGQENDYGFLTEAVSGGARMIVETSV